MTGDTQRSRGRRPIAIAGRHITRPRRTDGGDRDRERDVEGLKWRIVAIADDRDLNGEPHEQDGTARQGQNGGQPVAAPDEDSDEERSEAQHEEEDETGDPVVASPKTM